LYANISISKWKIFVLKSMVYKRYENNFEKKQNTIKAEPACRQAGIDKMLKSVPI
jgi:hypothetical protein